MMERPDEKPTAPASASDGPRTVCPAVAISPSPPSKLDQITKIAVIASIAVYLTGFIVAVHWYTKAGVPVAALTHDVFLAAGVQFLVVLGFALSPLISCFVIKWRIPSFKPASQHRSSLRRGLSRALFYAKLGLLLGGTLYAPCWGVHYVTGWSSLGHSIAFVVAILALSLMVVAKVRQERLGVIFRIGLFVPLPAVAATYYSAYLYPRSLAWLGGPRPTVLYRFNPSVTTPASLPSKEISCDPATSTERVRCRAIYLVHSDEKFVYTAVTDSSLPCSLSPTTTPTKTATWDDDVSRGASLCFVRIAADKFSPLKIPGPLRDP